MVKTVVGEIWESLTKAIAAPPIPAPQEAIPVERPLRLKKYWLGMVYAV